jgi:hypothetical protein
MIKTQVQIPDELFDKAKRVAAAKEWSFAEIVRRGLEYMTRVNPPRRESAKRWRLPEPVPMGQPLVPEADWTTLSHEDGAPA